MEEEYYNLTIEEALSKLLEENIYLLNNGKALMTALNKYVAPEHSMELAFFHDALVGANIGELLILADESGEDAHNQAKAEAIARLQKNNMPKERAESVVEKLMTAIESVRTAEENKLKNLEDDDESDSDKSSSGESGDSKSGDSGSGDGKSDSGESDSDKSGSGESGDSKSGSTESGDGKSDSSKSVWQENGFKDKFFKFSGRLNRKQYITRALPIWLMSIVMIVFLILIYDSFSTRKDVIMFSNVVVVILSIPMGISHLSLLKRRWQDLGKSSWWILTCFILPPVFAYLILFKKGTSGENKYGPDPLGVTANDKIDSSKPSRWKSPKKIIASLFAVIMLLALCIFIFAYFDNRL